MAASAPRLPSIQRVGREYATFIIGKKYIVFNQKQQRDDVSTMPPTRETHPWNHRPDSLGEAGSARGGPRVLGRPLLPESCPPPLPSSPRPAPAAENRWLVRAGTGQGEQPRATAVREVSACLPPGPLSGPPSPHPALSWASTLDFKTIGDS